MDNSLTDIAGVLVGHWTDGANGTGCTVVLTPDGACGGVDVRGSSPGTRETDLLDPITGVDRVHGIVLSGGSAYGLGAAHGAVRWLAENGYGWPTAAARVPIVSSAILYDLGFNGSAVYPTEADAYATCQTASARDTSRGNIGAGTGCTVGKLLGFANASRGGLGQASVTLPGGAVVAALVAVNAIGDIVDPTSAQIIAGARDPESGQLADALASLTSRFDSFLFRRPPVRENTSIGVVATNLPLTKAQATKLAQMAQAGITRTTRPAHTMYDGDCLFALGTGRLDIPYELSLLGAISAQVVAAAVLDGVRSASAGFGLPAAGELKPLPLAK
ncbi:MAG: P1 family peptidase [Caldilineaceae bacterium]|nr:P1 family peptidase [Caldilineaceae bacterium]